MREPCPWCHRFHDDICDEQRQGQADSPRTEAPDLRAALDALAEDIEDDDSRDGPPLTSWAARLRDLAALSATPAPERLDVERLALALGSVGWNHRGARQEAELIAAEYARLTEPQP
jgi:hypothetical protein